MRFGKGSHHTEETKKKISEHSAMWKGGKITTSGGYILIQKKSHPHANCMGYVLEHRLVMEEKIERYLDQSELVHHINDIRDDNRIENLMLVDRSTHNVLHKQGNHYTKGKTWKRNKPT
jgi:hypothetical protein